MRVLSTSACATLLAMMLGAATTKGQVYQDFAYYNESELPGRPISSSWSSVYGIFFYPTLPVSPVFTIERMRFWHFDPNADPDPFLVHIVVRNTGAEHIYLISTIENLWTTCTNCWEEVEIEMSFADASTPGWSFGVLMQPQGGFLTNAEPMIRRDSSASVPLVNLYATYVEQWGFGNVLYLEEYGSGNYFMEVTVRYDVTGAAVTSLSAIKALY